ncbi:hypothetical protein [Nocardioides anomalus]|uniref:hypothetical protein n=1 Tax=Nocardioides anomalus TaxID=2712223 RepID=UPI001E4F70C2|nr:hypothetical protein [Nocardioides anomalus]
MSAWQASRSDTDDHGRTVCQVNTRMRDESLLAAALADTQAVVNRSASILRADWAGVRADFTRDDAGVWQAHFTGDIDEERAVGIINAIDKAYGLQVQQAVLQRLKQRAPGAGLLLVSERTEADDSTTLVLEVGAVT